MQREFLFRGKTDTGVWIEGYLSNEDEITKYNNIGNYHRHKVIKETIGQFTGLLDKNGNKIFEGDIVKCANGHIGVVVWEEHDCCFNVEGYHNTCNNYPTMAFFEGDPEVIGNLTDNPELLK